jgi:hypothetical protein
MKKNPNNKGSGSKSKSKNKYEVIELPASNAEMEKYLEIHRKEINRRVVENIDYGIKMRLSAVEIFSFKNSNFVVLMNRKDFKENLQNIIDFSLKNQDFDVCKKAKMVMQKLDKVSIFFNYKKTK